MSSSALLPSCVKGPVRGFLPVGGLPGDRAGASARFRERRRPFSCPGRVCKRFAAAGMHGEPSEVTPSGFPDRGRFPSASVTGCRYTPAMSRIESPVTRAALDEVRAVYRDLAARPLERACERRTECCQFRLTGLTPYLTKGEAMLAARAFRATGRTSLVDPPDGACPLLSPDTGLCRVYADRPFGCRTHFCAAAGGPMPRRQVIDLIRRLEEVDRSLGGDGPRRLGAAVAGALREI